MRPFACLLGLMVGVSACGSADDVSVCGAPAPAPAPSPAPAPGPVEQTEPTLKITSFATSSSVVEFGANATLSWTIEGSPDEVLIDDVSVLGSTSKVVAPVRRQTFRLVANKGALHDERTVEVAARGIDLLAGQLASPGALDGPLDAASFNVPSSVAEAPDGTLVVADFTTSTVRRIGPTGVTTIAAAPSIYRPTAVAVAPSGLVYVADGAMRKVQTIAADGTVTTILGGTVGTQDGVGTNAQLLFPDGFVLLPAGEMILFDSRSVRHVAADLTVTTLFTSSGNGTVVDSPGTPTFLAPRHGARDAAGNIFVADWCRVRKIAPDWTVSTYAGGECGTATDDAPRATAVFGEIQGLTVDALGDVWVSDSYTRTIRRISAASGQVTTVAGNPVSQWPYNDEDGFRAFARFADPGALALRSTGSVVVADRLAHLVRSVSPEGLVTTIAGQRLKYGFHDGPRGENRTGGWTSFAVEPNGDIAMADSWYNSVRRLSKDGFVRTIAGGATQAAVVDGTGADARFGYPFAIMSEGGGSFIVGERTGLIRRVDPNGLVSTFTGAMYPPPGLIDGPRGVGAIRNPTGVVRDSKGNLFVADAGTSAIRVVRTDGSIETFAGGGPYGQVLDGKGRQAYIYQPQALAIDANDNLYFTDAGQLIRKITPDAVVTTIAGSFNKPGPVDGDAHDASFSQTVYGIAADAHGNVFVSDSGYNLIRKITPDGIVSTVAGTRGVFGLRAGPLPGSLFSPGPIAVTPAGDLILSCGAGVVQITAP